MIDPNQKIFKDPKTGRIKVQTINSEPSLTQQQFKDDADINIILKRHNISSNFRELTGPTGVYRDWTAVTDYHDSLNKVLKAQDAFASLPAEVRARFQNDPAQLLSFVESSSDEKIYAEGVSLGIFEDKNKPTPPNTPPPQNDLNETLTTPTTKKSKPSPPTEN